MVLLLVILLVSGLLIRLFSPVTAVSSAVQARGGGEGEREGRGRGKREEGEGGKRGRERLRERGTERKRIHDFKPHASRDKMRLREQMEVYQFKLGGNAFQKDRMALFAGRTEA